MCKDPECICYDEDNAVALRDYARLEDENAALRAEVEQGAAAVDQANSILYEYDVLRAEVAESERERKIVQAELFKTAADLAAAVEVIENLNRLACAAMIDANRDRHEYDITAELAEARAFLARMEVRP